MLRVFVLVLIGLQRHDETAATFGREHRVNALIDIFPFGIRIELDGQHAFDRRAGVTGRRKSRAMPVGCTERVEALRGWWLRGRVKLVTTNRSPQALRY